MKALGLVLFACLVSFAASAQPAPEATAAPKAFANESELGIASASGNSESNTYNAKETLSYTRNLDKVTAAARYLNTSAASVDTAKNWEAVLRYDRKTSNRSSVFIAYGIDSDRFAGFIQRTNADIGAKYEIAKSNETNWVAEAGYRYSYTMYGGPTPVDGAAHIIRIYSEANQKIWDTTTARIWVEYLPNLSDPDNYRINVEPSLVSQLNGYLSLKIGYLVKYQNLVVAPATGRSDRLFTTALVAKF